MNTSGQTSGDRQPANWMASRWALYGFAALLVASICGAAYLILGPDASSSAKSALAQEFKGAYPPEPAGGGQTVDIELVAAPSTIEVVEGLDTPVWAYNETVPGPPVRMNLGDTARISVRNELEAATTIHWHGIRVPNDMDGVPDLNQPRIEPGAQFVYEFTPPDAGTYWYHSHTDGSEQLERGLYGSLVVDDPAEGTSYDIDEVWMVDDWLLEDTGEIFPEFNTNHDLTHNGRWGTVVSTNGSTTTELTAAPGDRVRLRLVNASNGRTYMPDFGALAPTVIAIDGHIVGRNPDLAGLTLAPGNRIDVDITMPTTPGTYPVIDIFTGTPYPMGSIVVAGEAKADSAATFAPPTNPDVPEWADALDAPVDYELDLDIQAIDDQWKWTINGEVYPDVTPLKLPAGEFAKIKIVNKNHPMHPIHLHGQFFKVLTRNGEPVDEPYFRDTVLISMLEEVEIAMVPLDKGEWVLHCHIQEHAEAGMMTIMEVTDAA